MDPHTMYIYIHIHMYNHVHYVFIYIYIYDYVYVCIYIYIIVFNINNLYIIIYIYVILYVYDYNYTWRTGKSGWSSSQDVPYGPPKRLPCWKNIGAGEVCFTNRYKPRILILEVLQGRLWVGNLQGKKTQKERLGTCRNLSEVFFFITRHTVVYM